MTLPELVDRFRRFPLVASAQATPGSPLENVETICQLAEASWQEGVGCLRMEGVESISAFRARCEAPVIGLIKRQYPGSEVYITPTKQEVSDLIAAGCEVVALDATSRTRPGGESLGDLIPMIHQHGRLVLADCDTEEAATRAVQLGADLVSTTLSGYTDESPHQDGPDIALVRQLSSSLGVPVLAEGRYAEAWQARAALCAGAVAVVVGGALNDPVKQTRRFAGALEQDYGLIGAVDLGGTWLRFACFDAEGAMRRVEKTTTPDSFGDRTKWIREMVQTNGCSVVGISAGGTIDPATGEVVETKETIRDNRGRYCVETVGAPCLAINDGLATAWGHACHPGFAGLRTVTLALGTGVGCGLVDQMRIWTDSIGRYLRMNDLPFDGGTIESVLGGAELGTKPTDDALARASEALYGALRIIDAMLLPDQIILCGSVGLNLKPHQLLPSNVSISPFGADAGLYGAAALVRIPPNGWKPQ